jgi:tetratricopeptide (TPR) repeat protein
MSKVALRVYNRDIEALVDQGHLDEAIAHCQHILKEYPKHLETYRLLGKAYLESRQFGDAADIFQRVLMTVPDDFISQLGMSIVSDEQKDLNAAIWHMERAFEVNPSNAGVQGELRRLYGRRDGLEPPKIRLTRGALAQMYTKGGQYQQAIAEIKSVLGEDPSRIEMRVLLARAYFRGGQKVEATEMCIELLKQFPYCLDANRILVEVLPGTSLAQNLETYKKRVEALDPYSALVTGSIFDVENIPDNAVTLERLEWEPGAGTRSSAGFSPAQSAQSGEAALPDFLKTAGWGPSSGEFKEGPMQMDAEEPAAAPPAGELAAAQIPDWLQAMAPPSSTPSQPAEPDVAPAPAELASEDLDWLAGLGGPVAAGGAAELPSQPAPATPAESQPDWLKDLAAPGLAEQLPGDDPLQPANAAPADAQPDWLKNLGEAPVDPVSPPPVSPPTETTEQPDWLKSLAGNQVDPAPAAEQAPAAAVPAMDDDMDWLKNLGGMQDTPAAITESAPIPQPEANVNKDLSGDEEDIPPMTAPVSGPGTSESEQDDAMKWLESLAQKQGAKAEELITNPDERTEHAPDWVARVDDAPAAPAAATPIPEPPKFVMDPAGGFDDDAPPGELSPLTSGPGTTESEQDDAMKWLESLAQKQGAKAEELITNPQERTENAPGWVGQVTNPAAEMPAAPAPPEPATATGEPDPDDSMKWLEGLGAASTPTAATGDEAPGWVTESAGSAPAPTPATPEPPASDKDDTMAWLQSLAAGQPASTSSDDAVAPTPMERMPWEQEVTPPPAAEQTASPDVSDWLKSLDVQAENPAPDATPQPAESAPVVTPPSAGVPEPPTQPQPVSPAPAAPDEGVPDWLNDMRAPAEQAQAAQEDLPDWLKDQSADEQPPATVPAPVWEPAEPAPAPVLGVMEPPPAAVPVAGPPPTPVEPVPPMPSAPAQSAPATPPAVDPAPIQPPAPAVQAPQPAAANSAPQAPAPRPAVRETGLLGDKDGPALQKARDLLAHGGLDAAVSEYAKLVKRGKLLEEVIYDLKEATYTHPVDVVIWQTLGDAHMRANQLQDALDAYTKAEELLR